MIQLILWFFANLCGEDRILNKFLESPEKYYDRSTPWYFRAQNYMAFDLGLDFEDNSPAYIKKAIQVMEKRFGLVLLTDYFEESLILLKGKLSAQEKWRLFFSDNFVGFFPPEW